MLGISRLTGKNLVNPMHRYSLSEKEILVPVKLRRASPPNPHNAESTWRDTAVNAAVSLRLFWSSSSTDRVTFTPVISQFTQGIVQRTTLCTTLPKPSNPQIRAPLGLEGWPNIGERGGMSQKLVDSGHAPGSVRGRQQAPGIQKMLALRGMR
jgi:hypothetical protein